MITLIGGIPASGKTTHAKALLESDSNAVRVNRDSLRNFCYSVNTFGAVTEYTKTGVYPTPYEGMVTELQKAFVMTAVKNGKNVIVDNCFATARSRSQFKTIVPRGTIVKMVFFNLPLELCLERNRIRESKISESAIRNMLASLTLPDEDWFENIEIISPCKILI